MIRALREIYRFRVLLWNLTVREIKARYRGSVLGFLWSLANPILLLAVYTFVFGFVFQPRIEGADPYALFLVTGLFPWIWISTSILEGTVSLTGNAGLLRKAAFPSELLPMVSVLSNLAHFFFAVPIIALALGIGRYLGYPVGGWAFLLLPVIVLVGLPMVAGITLGLSALNVHFKDVRDMTTHAVTLFFFLTPILYLLEGLPSALQVLIHLNPFTPFILLFQEALFYGRMPGPLPWLHTLAAGLMLWVAGAALFERLRDTLVEAA